MSLLARPHDHRRALVLAPFLWVAIELARTRISGYPWNLLGIAQIDNVALCRTDIIVLIYPLCRFGVTLTRA